MASVTSYSCAKKISKPWPTRLPFTNTTISPPTAPKCSTMRLFFQSFGIGTVFSIQAACRFSQLFGYDGYARKSPPNSFGPIEYAFTFHGDGILIGVLSHSPDGDPDSGMLVSESP